MAIARGQNLGVSGPKFCGESSSRAEESLLDKHQDTTKISWLEGTLKWNPGGLGSVSSSFLNYGLGLCDLGQVIWLLWASVMASEVILAITAEVLLHVRCWLLEFHPGDFPGSPVVKTPQSQCREFGLDP